MVYFVVANPKGFPTMPLQNLCKWIVAETTTKNHGTASTNQPLCIKQTAIIHKKQQKTTGTTN